jgi:farnesyl-diphosphate farnesyltransferase
MSFHEDAMNLLSATSRTFYIPISRLPPGLLEAVASAYLCMRGIDEIEDHPQLPNPTKAELLRAISLQLESLADDLAGDDLAATLASFGLSLPEVTLRLGEWTRLAPRPIAARICDATAAMADRMAHWAAGGWRIDTETDLNRYTFSVAGAVGLLLSDLWAWYDGTQTNRWYAIGFGRGLQAVNILRNRADDLARGVDFFPQNWDEEHMQVYARSNLQLAEAYVSDLPPGPALDFCRIPLALAVATLDVLARGEDKLSRSDVHRLVEQATRDPHHQAGYYAAGDGTLSSSRARERKAN